MSSRGNAAPFAVAIIVVATLAALVVEQHHTDGPPAASPRPAVTITATPPMPPPILRQCAEPLAARTMCNAFWLAKVNDHAGSHDDAVKIRVFYREWQRLKQEYSVAPTPSPS